MEIKTEGPWESFGAETQVNDVDFIVFNRYWFVGQYYSLYLKVITSLTATKSTFLT